MKIVQVMPEFELAGAEIMCENLIYELIKLGHKVITISMYDYHSAITERLEKAGVIVYYLHKKPGLDLSIIFKIKKILQKEKVDVIHTHRYCAQYAVPAAILAGVKRRVHTVHNIASQENGKLAKKLNGFFFRYCGLIPVALSKKIKDSIVSEYKINENRIPIIFNGIDLSKCISKKDYTIKGNFKILHIGRFSEQKNHIGLLQAFKLFNDKYKNSELWLIGEGGKKIEIEKYVKDNNLALNVHFLGRLNDVYMYLYDADIFVLPSNYEGTPMTLIEAMGTGLPIIATAVGGIPDMLDKDSAILTEIDANSIAKAFETYYLDSELRRTHGQAAKFLSSKFSAITMADKYIEIYK